MDNYTAIMIAEGVIEPKDEQKVIQAWQQLIDTGIAWRLQGWFGRQAKFMIETGLCKRASK